MKKQIFISLLVCFLIVAALGGVKFMQISAAIAAGKNQGPPPVAVTTIKASAAEWRTTRSAVGSLTAVNGAMLSTEQAGRVAEVHFESGALVEKGQLLVSLDTGVEQAELDGAEARFELARINQKRQQQLRAKNANAPSDLDNAEATLREAKAEVERLRSVIMRKQIRAPFAGRAGIRQVNVGETVSVGTAVVSVHSFSTLFVDFSLPQEEVLALKPGMSLTATVGERSATGVIEAIDAAVEQATRTVNVRGRIANSSGELRPGMFVSVEVDYGRAEQYVTIPASSINFAPYGNSEFVVQDMSKLKEGELPQVEPQTVVTGRKRGDQVAVVSGLAEGQEIVTAGVFRLQPGTRVIINNSVAPGNNPAPTPANT